MKYCNNEERILNEAFQLDQELVFGAIADLEGIKDIFYNQSDYFDCDLNKNTTDIIALMSNNSETVWNALLQSQNAAYWLKTMTPIFYTIQRLNTLILFVPTKPIIIYMLVHITENKIIL